MTRKHESRKVLNEQDRRRIISKIVSGYTTIDRKTEEGITLAKSLGLTNDGLQICLYKMWQTYHSAIEIEEEVEPSDCVPEGKSKLANIIDGLKEVEVHATNLRATINHLTPATVELLCNTSSDWCNLLVGKDFPGYREQKDGKFGLPQDRDEALWNRRLTALLNQAKQVYKFLESFKMERPQATIEYIQGNQDSPETCLAMMCIQFSKHCKCDNKVNKTALYRAVFAAEFGEMEAGEQVGKKVIKDTKARLEREKAEDGGTDYFSGYIEELLRAARS